MVKYEILNFVLILEHVDVYVCIYICMFVVYTKMLSNYFISEFLCF